MKDLPIRREYIAKGYIKPAGPSGMTSQELGRRGFVHAAFLGGYNRIE